MTTQAAASGTHDLNEIAERSNLSGAALVTWGDQAWEHGDIDAQFVIYSITKSVISAAILLLVDDGVLDLETPVSDALDDERFDATLRQLLTHVGGIPDYGPLPAYHAAVYSNPSQPWTDEMVPREGARRRARPHARQEVGVLQRRLHASPPGLGRPRRLGVYPPGAWHSAASVADDLSGFDHAVPAVSAKIGEGFHDVRGRYHPAWVAHRTLVTTARELHRFWSRPLAAFLDPASIVPVARSGFGFDQVSWGLGVMVLTDPENPPGPVVGHGGGGPGYSAAMFAAPSMDALAIVLEPTEDFPVQETALALLRAATDTEAGRW